MTNPATAVERSDVYENHRLSEHNSTPSESLARRRDATAVQWRRFRNRQPLAEPHGLQEDILASWERSVGDVETFQLHAPGDDRASAERYWQDSYIGQAAESSLSAIVEMAEEGDLVASIADPNGRLI
ncbi:MAG: hypothetical protein ABW109_22700, partial [Candidatus Thiodiazotropha sp. 6PLUC4]